MTNQALKELLDEHNPEEIFKLMGFEIVDVVSEEIWTARSDKNGNFKYDEKIGYDERLTIKREVR